MDQGQRPRHEISLSPINVEGGGFTTGIRSRGCTGADENKLTD